jgi:dipeptidase D
MPRNSAAIKISVSGLLGGHSGDDIHKNRGNAIKILTRFLWKASREFSIGLSEFIGGNLRNAIAREASAIFVFPKNKKENLLDAFEKFTAQVKFEFEKNEPNLKLKAEEIAIPEHIIDAETQKNLLNSLYACPHGVLEMSTRMEGMVETSTNLASVKFEKGNKIKITPASEVNWKAGNFMPPKWFARFLNWRAPQ